MKTRMKTIMSATALAVMIVAAGFMLDGCKKTYFQIAEEPSGPPPLRFTVQKADYDPMRAISLAEGKFAVVPGQNTILFIEGTAVAAGSGEASVATMDLRKIARFYMTLPLEPTVGRYTIASNSICELIGGGNPGTGDNIFMGDSGEIVIDSLKHGRIYGAFNGGFRNSGGRQLTVNGAIKAGRK